MKYSTAWSSNYSMMSYEINHLDPVPEEPEVEMEGSEGSEADMDSRKASDETLPFLRWKLTGDVANTNPARNFYKRGVVRYCLLSACTLFPWMMNIVLAIIVVALVLHLQYKTTVVVSKANGIPTDVMYSECSRHVLVEKLSRTAWKLWLTVTGLQHWPKRRSNTG